MTKQEQERLRQFFIEQSKDPRKRAEFWANPEKVLRSSDISEEHVKILTSGICANIYKLISQAFEAHEEGVIIICCIIIGWSERGSLPE